MRANKKLVTMRDIAKAAGVSKTTVSVVLNNRDSKIDISEETRQRIIRIASEYRYRPHAAGRNLRSQRTLNIAFATHSIEYLSVQSFSQTIAGIGEVLGKRGYSMQFAVSSNSQSVMARNQHFLRKVDERRVDGVVIYDQACSPEDMSRLQEERVPFVLIDREWNSAHCVIVDYQEGIMRGMQHMADHGHKNIALAVMNTHMYTGASLVAAYRNAVALLDLSYEKTIEARNQPELLRAQIDLLASSDRPTAMFLPSSKDGLAAIRLAAKLGLAVPKDLALMCIEDEAITLATHPSITAIRVPWIQIGRVAGEMVVSLAEGANVDNAAVRLEPELIPRGSCGCPEPVLWDIASTVST